MATTLTYDFDTDFEGWTNLYTTNGYEFQRFNNRGSYVLTNTGYSVKVNTDDGTHNAMILRSPEFKIYSLQYINTEIF